MSVRENVRIVLATFAAVERRDRQRLHELYHPDVEFHWAASLRAALGETNGEAMWDSVQPTESERRMDPRVVAANDDGEVVVLWVWRGVRPTGRRFQCEVLGLYQVRDEKFARAQMFFFDTAAVSEFIASIERDGPTRAADHSVA